MREKYVRIGLMMVSVGMLVLAANMGAVSGIWVLIAAAAGFLALYVWNGRHVGLLIPGLFIAGLAGFAALDSFTGALSGGYLFFFFAAAFYLVYAIHTCRITGSDRGERIWPLFPGTALLAVGMLVFGIEGNYFNEAVLRSMNMLLPAGLILGGILVFVRHVWYGSSR